MAKLVTFEEIVNEPFVFHSKHTKIQRGLAEDAMRYTLTSPVEIKQLLTALEKNPVIANSNLKDGLKEGVTIRFTLPDGTVVLLRVQNDKVVGIKQENGKPDIALSVPELNNIINSIG